MGALAAAGIPPETPQLHRGTSPGGHGLWRALLKQLLRCGPGRPVAEQVPVLQPAEGPVLRQVDVPPRKLQLVLRNPRRSRLLAGAAARGGPTLGQLVPGGLYPVERTPCCGRRA